MSKEELLKVLGPGNLPAWIGSPDCMRVSWVNDMLGNSVLHGTGLPCGPTGMVCAMLVRLSRCHTPGSSDPATSASGVGHQHCPQAGIACSGAMGTTQWVLDGHPVHRRLVQTESPCSKAGSGSQCCRTHVLSSAEQLWPRLQDVFNLRYKEVVEPLIQQSKPRWVFETRVLSFEIGDVPPTITGVKAFKESSSPNHVSFLLQ